MISIVTLWLRTVPSKVWLAVAIAVVAASVYAAIYQAGARHAEADVAASAMRASVQQRAHLREAVVEITVARDAAFKAARDTADAYAAKAAFLTQKVVAYRIIPPPTPTVLPSGDVSFTEPVWEQHLADDAKRDTLVEDLSAIVQHGIPAIRNQYEAALAKDVKLFALKDSLVNNAEARVRLLTAMKEGPRFVPHVGWGLACGVTVAGYRPQCVVGVTLGWGR